MDSSRMSPHYLTEEHHFQCEEITFSCEGAVQAATLDLSTEIIDKVRISRKIHGHQ